MSAADGRKVLIRGHVFDYEEKAPFVVSGVSVFGAVEYDDAKDVLKCHECGEWFTKLANHAVRAHDLATREYKFRHGLNLTSGLTSLSLRRKAAAFRVANNTPETLSAFAISTARDRSGDKRPAAHSQFEVQNIRGRCKAQMIFRIQSLAQKLGRTPSVTELDAAGIYQAYIRKLFGEKLKTIIEMAGLVPNGLGARNGDRKIPEELLLAALRDFYLRSGRMPRYSDFPSPSLPGAATYNARFGTLKAACLKAKIPTDTAPKLNDRMPWPAGHSDVGIIALERRSA